jgi:hydrogenase maturation protein HypF
MQAALNEARRIHAGGVVQGVGFRPFVYRMATDLGVSGWVLNAERGVEIHVEGTRAQLDEFLARLRADAPPAAQIAELDARAVAPEGFASFEIRRSEHAGTPTVRVCADLPVCDDCLRELFDPADRRYRYPYINCTNCGPRYSIVLGLPYDRPHTTMRDFPMCEHCRCEYEDPRDRRFHAQPVACAQCGPTYVLQGVETSLRGYAGIARAARMLSDGAILAVKGIGGYHLACDARNARAVEALRTRKYRKERPFALMVRRAEDAAAIADLDERAMGRLSSPARPIVLARASVDLAGIAPDNDDYGIMLAYTPVHHLLFDAGAPTVLVMTSANRSSEPIAYRDEDARSTLYGIADAMLAGERQIARRIDDSVVSSIGVIRHARGLAPQAVTSLPSARPILAVGADLKNAVALVVNGQAFVSQYVGDLEYADAYASFEATIADLQALYELPQDAALVAYDAHPQYRSSQYASDLANDKLAVQHHRAHVAGVLAEREAFETPVLGFAFDGTGYGDDGTIWGGEVFSGTLADGLDRVAHLRSAQLPGGDGAARFPVQAAAGFLYALGDDRRLTDLLEQPPFSFPKRYRDARELVRRGVRTFATTSMGRLFDTVAALLGFTREITFEAQAAMWLEHLARGSAPVAPYEFPFAGGELDYRPLLAQIVADRLHGRDEREIARAFHAAIAAGMLAIVHAREAQYVAVSGGVFQNVLLVEVLRDALGERLWTNRRTPANDGGICLGQAAIAAITPR